MGTEVWFKLVTLIFLVKKSFFLQVTAHRTDVSCKIRIIICILWNGQCNNRRLEIPLNNDKAKFLMWFRKKYRNKWLQSCEIPQFHSSANRCALISLLQDTVVDFINSVLSQLLTLSQQAIVILSGWQRYPLWDNSSCGWYFCI